MDKENFGRLLVILRRRKGLSQREFADLMCTSSSTVCKWEKGVSIPNREMMLQIAEFYHISSESLCSPEKTLMEIENTSLLNMENKISDDLAMEGQGGSQSVIKERFIYRKWKTFVVVVLIIIVICSLFTMVFMRENEEPHVTCMVERYIEDPDYGEIYEIDCVTNEEPSHDWIDKYMNSYIVDYLQQKELSTNVAKLVFYDNVENVMNDYGIQAEIYIFLDQY